MELTVWQEAQVQNEIDLMCCGYGLYEFSIEPVGEEAIDTDLSDDRKVS